MIASAGAGPTVCPIFCDFLMCISASFLQGFAMKNLWYDSVVYKYYFYTVYRSES